MTDPIQADAAKARAEALFRQPGDAERQAVDPAKLAEAEKTAKLRALRLGRERTEVIAAEVRRTRREMQAPRKS